MENKKYKILFVCTQNVFRSMSAHYLALKYTTENNIDIYEIDSCGTVAYDWESPYQHTIIQLQKRGIDARNHVNKKANKKLIDDSDIIICMTQSHACNIKNNFGKDSYLFNELALGKKTDLEDDNEANFDCSLNKFIEKTVGHIDTYIPTVITNLHKIVSNK